MKQKEFELRNDRLEIRKQIQEAGKNLYESLGFCKPLQNIAGEFMDKNEEYVINHDGVAETIATQNILTNGFTDNQIIFLTELEKIIKTAPYNELLQVVLQKVNEMVVEEGMKGGGSLSVWTNLNQLKTEIESCGTRPAIILKKKR